MGDLLFFCEEEVLLNLTLIGMPGCGKSTIGRVLAKSCGMRFVDVDKVMMERTGCPLSQTIEQVGDEGFRALENEVNAGLQVENTVLAPGGSVVYGKEAMEHLRSISRVIYLKLSEQELLERLGDLHARGVSFRPGQTFHDLYMERSPLYERYAHTTIDVSHDSISEVVRIIRGICGI